MRTAGQAAGQYSAPVLAGPVPTAAPTGGTVEPLRPTRSEGRETASTDPPPPVRDGRLDHWVKEATAWKI
ncbi:MAG: hypothetical protein LIP77_04765, partial [Planctomycetes bacterium]|nr:hypothetical protein [Planctomycetota bacterium]